MNLVLFDLETTDVDPNTCRIVQYAFWVPGEKALINVVNPGVTIQPEASEAHGFRDEDVAELPFFDGAAAAEVQEAVQGKTLVGYNCRRFDTPILHRELVRAGQEGLVTDGFGEIIQPEIDLFLCWRHLEPRTLTGALERFGVDFGEEWTAHDAWEDVRVLFNLLESMSALWGKDLEDFKKISSPEDTLDRDGKFAIDDRGRPIITFGKHEGTPISNVPSDYLRWMLKQDFSTSTKAVIRRFLGFA